MTAHKPHTRVAHRTSRRIDEVDGVPTTHTQHGWVHAWTVTDGVDRAAPLPFAAKKNVPAWVAVSAMLAVVLIATAAALLSVTAEHPDQSRVVAMSFVALGGFCLLVAMPALVRALSRLTRATRTDR